MTSDHAKQYGVRPVMVALAIAIFGLVAMLLVDHGPWARPHAQSAEVADFHTTGEAARAATCASEPDSVTSTDARPPPRTKRTLPFLSSISSSTSP